MSTTTRLQFDQTCPVGYIFDHLFSWRRFNNLNQSDSYEMDAICERFKVIAPSHGVTQKLYFPDLQSLDTYFLFKILGHLLRRHAVSRLMIGIDTKIFRIILGLILGGSPQKSAIISSKVRFFIPYTHVKLGDIFPSFWPPIQIGAGIFIPSSPEPNRGKYFHPILPWVKLVEGCHHHLLIQPYTSGW